MTTSPVGRRTAVASGSSSSPNGTRRRQLVVCVAEQVFYFELPLEGAVTIGRAEDNAVRIEHPSISRHHAVLHLAERLSIEDLGGANGTIIRDPRASPREGDTHGVRRLARETGEVSVGDGILFGTVSSVVRNARDSAGDFPALDPHALQTGEAVIRDAALGAVYAQADRAARSPLSVLILGETGVGKELLARAVHSRSARSGAPFSSINCAAISETLLEGELFGHERGAFTGAHQARAGLFEAADGGTVFLDEVGELSPTTQAKLLRVLEDRSVVRLGARAPRHIDVRFVAATNRDLEADARVGSFRADLYFRLAGVTLTVPPLRERTADLEPLVEAFVARICRELERPPVRVSVDAMRCLRAYPWPGNVRELKNAIERAVVLSDTDVLTTEALPTTVLKGAAAPGPVSGAPGLASNAIPPPPAPPANPHGPAHRGEPVGAGDEVRALERARIVEALQRSGGNQTEAARLMGISRRTLVSRLTVYGLPRPRKRGPLAE